MKEVPFANKEDHAVHIGNKMVPPHETRMVDPSMLPNAHESHGRVAPETPSDPLLDILDGTIAEITEALPGLSDEELNRLEQAEKDGNTRKGVEKAIAEERLTRASLDQNDDDSDDDGDNPDTDAD